MISLNPLPRIRPEFLECVRAVDDEIPLDYPGHSPMGGRGRGGCSVARGKGGGRRRGWVTASINVKKIFDAGISSCG